MKNINEYLLNDEKILWERREKKNPIKGYRASFWILPLIIVISILIAWGIFIISEEDLGRILTLTITLIIISPILGGFIYILFDYKRFLEIYALEESKQYENLDIITNQRYIRKNYRANMQYKRYLKKRYSPDAYKIEKDILFLNLDKIQVVFVQDPFEGNDIAICFYPIWDEDHPEQTYLFFEVNYETYDAAMSAISKVIPIGRKKRDSDGIIYSRAKQGESIIQEFKGSDLTDQEKEHIHYCPHCGEQLYCKACGKEID